MKKKDIVDLIKYHVNKNDSAFKVKSMEIAKEFEQMGDTELANSIVSLVSTNDVLTPQSLNVKLNHLIEVDTKHSKYFPVPDSIADNVKGIINAVSHNMGVNKFLFEGKPGTGKTETAKIIASLLNRRLLKVDFDSLVDSHLGQTSKNISEVFKEINNYSLPNEIIILMDEIDAIALDRVTNNDVREMGRATSAVLKGLDELNPDVVLIATTNLYQYFDKALSRRFDLVVDFDAYTKQDLIDAAIAILTEYLDKQPNLDRDTRLLKKIINLYGNKVPLPGDMKNVVKTAIAFSNPDNPTEYLTRLYKTVTGKQPDAKILKKEKFTIRESAALLNTSRATVSRKLKEE